MRPELLNLVDETSTRCDDSWSDLLGSSAQEVQSTSLDVVKAILVKCQREARSLVSEATHQEKEPLRKFLEAVRSADKSRRVLAGLVAQRDQFIRRRSASAAVKDLEAMEGRFDEFVKDLYAVRSRGVELLAVLKRPQARVQRRGEIRVVIDDEAS
ncbi:hypothetical protein ACTMUQ_33685 [Streptomyces sp. SD11]|uniref:hypothetical protein n=1 Tax=Streptomyces sp. SD11 TaxID=3452209 RepID=UPI003F8C4851